MSQIASSGPSFGYWYARTLLSSKEHNRLLFLLENAVRPEEVTREYEGATSLLSLYVMMGLAGGGAAAGRETHAHSRFQHLPTVAAIEKTVRRAAQFRREELHRRYEKWQDNHFIPASETGGWTSREREVTLPYVSSSQWQAGAGLTSLDLAILYRFCAAYRERVMTRLKPVSSGGRATRESTASDGPIEEDEAYDMLQVLLSVVDPVWARLKAEKECLLGKLSDDSGRTSTMGETSSSSSASLVEEEEGGMSAVWRQTSASARSFFTRMATASSEASSTDSSSTSPLSSPSTAKENVREESEEELRQAEAKEREEDAAWLELHLPSTPPKVAEESMYRCRLGAIEIEQICVATIIWQVLMDERSWWSAGEAIEAKAGEKEEPLRAVRAEGGVSSGGGAAAAVGGSSLARLSGVLCSIVDEVLSMTPAVRDRGERKAESRSSRGCTLDPLPHQTFSPSSSLGGAAAEGLSFASARRQTVLQSLSTHIRDALLQLLCVTDLSGGNGVVSASRVITPIALPYSTQQSSVVLWLLREAADSAACRQQFECLAASRPTVAMEALRQSGLLDLPRSERAIWRVSTVLLPLLLKPFSEAAEGAGEEAAGVVPRSVGVGGPGSGFTPEFVGGVLSEVLQGLESRLRCGGPAGAFTRGELDALAVLGAVLFNEQYAGGEAQEALAAPAHRGTSLESFGTQLEEIEVMEGSPMALIKTMYHWIRHTLTKDIGFFFGNHMPKKGENKGDVQKEEKAAKEGKKEDRSRGAGSSTPDERGGIGLSATLPSATNSLSAVLVSNSIRQRFLKFLEALIRSFAEQQRAVESELLYQFVECHVPVPNIQDEYRRKLYFLVNVTGAADGAASSTGSASKHPADDTIPQELRLLVSALPHTLSPYASVAILREVLSSSAGMNARYTYVCRAALDLQLPVSTTRSRIATVMNMWSFLRTQSKKLPYAEWLLMQKRCLVNFPLSYIWSSYWVVLSWAGVLLLVALHFFGADYESSVLASGCRQKFGVPEELLVPVTEEDAEGREVRLDDQVDPSPLASTAAEKVRKQEEADGVVSAVGVVASPLPSPSRWGSSGDVPWTPQALHDKFDSAAGLWTGLQAKHTKTLLALMPFLSRLLGWDNGELKATLYILDRSAPPTSSFAVRRTEGARYEETGFQRAMFLIEKMSVALRYPFFVDIEKPLAVELIEARVAERMRRVSTNHTWFWLRPVVRFFPLGVHKTEVHLIENTCIRAERQQNRLTFLIYFHEHVPVTPALLKNLRLHSAMGNGANMVIIAHADSLVKGGLTEKALQKWSATGETLYTIEYYPPRKATASSYSRFGEIKNKLLKLVPPLAPLLRFEPGEERGTV